jgi:hypothetical protein
MLSGSVFDVVAIVGAAAFLLQRRFAPFFRGNRTSWGPPADQRALHCLPIGRDQVPPIVANRENSGHRDIALDGC